MPNFSLLLLALAPIQAEDAPTPGLLLDAYIDLRHEATDAETRALLDSLADLGVEAPERLESLLRQPRGGVHDLSELAGKVTEHEVDCDHVDYSSRFLMSVPEGYDADEPWSLVVVGHGGNSSMSAERAMRTARAYIDLYAPGIHANMRALVVAPASERGWGPIGYSLVFSTISKVKRMAPIDPDRVYLTGQSMGGHLTYRAGLLFPDAWGAISPHSGGYDFAKKGSITNLLNVPGLAIFGAREPYAINGDNKANAAWAAENAPHWTFVEKNGGHEIYVDELPRMAKFFVDHPRDPYRKEVHLRQGGSMLFEKTWGIEGWPEHTVRSQERPLRWNTRHWLEVTARPDLKEPLEVRATLVGDNRIEVTSANAPGLKLGLHPKMVDFDQPVVVTVNGESRFEGKVEVDLEQMLNRVREKDDRGRIYWATVDLDLR